MSVGDPTRTFARTDDCGGCGLELDLTFSTFSDVRNSAAPVARIGMVVTAAAAAMLSGCGPSDQCRSDDDCSGARVCENSTCVDPDWTVGDDTGPDTDEPVPEIEVPEALEFQAQGTPGRDETIVEVQNRGDDTLRVTRLEPEVGEAFSVSYPDSRESPPDADTGDATPFDVEPRESRLVRVVFEPTDSGTVRDAVVAESNDPDDSLTRFDLVGRVDAGPCLEATPDGGVEFGGTELGTTATDQVVLENCSDETPISLVTAETAPRGTFAAPFDTQVTLEPGERHEQEVRFTPNEAKSYTAVLAVETDPDAGGPIKIELSGTGVEPSDCPTAKAGATVRGESSDPSDDLETEPLRTIQLDGRDSTAKVGTLDSWEWTVANRPTDSHARFAPASDIADPTILLDLVGTYEFHLTVTDTEGNESCNTAAVEVTAEPSADIYVETVWGTPKDSDATDDSGADLDLHYLNPKGSSWNEAPWDIYWDNKTADWGREDVADDDPELVAVDDDGAGPEAVSHVNPRSGSQYPVGVYYYDDNGFGTSYATARIYIKQKQASKFVGQKVKQFWFWKVAAVEWPTGNILTRDTTHKSGFPQ
jgi:hypothetical protein